MYEYSLHIRRLSYRIGQKPILSDIDLTLPAGKVSVLLGPNGAGKTTLLKMIAGLRLPSTGETCCGAACVQSLTTVERAKLIAYVPQHIPQGIPLSVQEFVALGRVPHQGSFSRLRGEDQTIIDEALLTTELHDYRHARLDALSGGERQRAAIARALAQSAPVLLLDEPTNHLDLRHQHKLQLLLTELAQRGKTVVEVLHDLHLACEYADHAALLESGKLVSHGQPEQALTDQLLEAVYRWPVRMRMQLASARCA